MRSRPILNRRLVLIIPPEYFPTPETAACMVRADDIVLLDTVQYSRQSFQNRTRIRNPDGAQWLTVPIRAGQFGDSIAETVVDTTSDWQRLHDKALRFNYSTSPFFMHYRPALDEVLNSDMDLLADITCRAMRVAANLLGCRAPVTRASRLKGRPNSTAGVLALFSGGSRLIPASVRDESHSAPGVVCAAFSEQPAERPAESPWRQNFDGFVSGVGSLDLLFNLGPAARDTLLASSRLDS